MVTFARAAVRRDLVRSLRVLGLSICLAGSLALAGCGGDPDKIRDVLPIVGIAYNDSLGPGDTLFLKVQYTYVNSCQTEATFEIQQLNDSTYAVTPVANYTEDDACTGASGSAVAVLKVLGLGTGLRHFLVAGANTIITADVRTGTDATLTGYRFRVRVEDRVTRTPVPLAPVEIRDATEAGEVLATGSTDTSGVFVHEQPCNRPPFPYFLFASQSGRTQNLLFPDPPLRCGMPEVIVIRV